MSLKTKLNDYLKAQGGKVVPISQLEALVRSWGYKISNYERRLRPSESPNIAHVMDKKAIIGYYWTPHTLITVYPYQITANEFLARFPSKTEKQLSKLF